MIILPGDRFLFTERERESRLQNKRVARSAALFLSFSPRARLLATAARSHPDVPAALLIKFFKKKQAR